MTPDGYERIDFSTATLSYLQRKDKTVKDSEGNPFHPWRACLSYYVETGTNEDGTPRMARRQKNRTFPASVKTLKTAKTEGNRWLASLKQEQEEAMGNVAVRREREEAERARAARLTVWQCVDDYIEESAAGGYIEASTVLDYRNSARRIRRSMEDVAVDDLTPEKVEEWADALRKTNAYSTVKKTRNVLRAAIDHAMQRGRVSLERNPVPKTRKTVRDKARDRQQAPKLNWLDKDNRTSLLSQLAGMEQTPVTVAAQIALYMGLREAEICALLWSDVDLDAGTLDVNKAIGKRDGGLYVKPLKGLEEERALAINPELLPILRKWRAKQWRDAAAVDRKIDLGRTFVVGDPATYPPAECFAWQHGIDRLAAEGEDDTKLIGNPDAYPDGVMNPRILSRKWNAVSSVCTARGRLGQPATFHNLRHTFGFYMANEAGVPIETLARWMGHKSTSTTLRYYVARDKAAKLAEDMETMRRVADAGVVRSRPADVYRLNGTEG